MKQITEGERNKLMEIEKYHQEIMKKEKKVRGKDIGLTY